MAVTSGSFDTTHRISGSYNTYATFSWWVSGSGTNYTDVSWNLTGKTANSGQYIYVYSASVTVNGATYSSWSGNMYNGTVMLSNTTRIYHTGEFTFSASASIAQYSSSSIYSGNGSWTLPARATSPTGLDVTLTSIQDTGAVMAVSLGSYGNPSGEANRYIEAAIMAQSTYGGKYRYATQKATTSATITVNNSSSTNSSNPLTIVPNTQYWYGAYATNTSMSTSTVKGTFITLPAYISDVVANDTGHGNIVISVLHASEGTATTAYTEYSYDQTNWTTVSDEFRIVISSQTTVYVRRRNSSGTTPTYALTIMPATTAKLYGSVNNQAKEIRKLYGSVNNKSVRIRKLYASVNGRSKLVFEDNDGAWANRGMGTDLNPYGIGASYGDTVSVDMSVGSPIIDVEALANGLVMGAGYYRIYLPANTVQSGSRVEFGILEECFGGDDYATMPTTTIDCDNEYITAIVIYFREDYSITYVRGE